MSYSPFGRVGLSGPERAMWMDRSFDLLPRSPLARWSNDFALRATMPAKRPLRARLGGAHDFALSDNDVDPPV